MSKYRSLKSSHRYRSVSRGWHALIAIGILLGCLVPLNTFAYSTGKHGNVPRVLEGSVWSGLDSEGAFYEYTFLPNGRLKYRTNTERKEIVAFDNPNNRWKLRGNVLTITKNNSYSTQVGFISGNRIQGRAWNILGKKWRWSVKKKR